MPDHDLHLQLIDLLHVDLHHPSSQDYSNPEHHTQHPDCSKEVQLQARDYTLVLAEVDSQARKELLE